MDQKKIKILVIDDERDIVEFLRYNLEKEGYETAAAFNGRQGLEMAESLLPDLILLDIMMPEMDGYEACREIRTKPSLKDTRILFLTAKSDDISQIKGLEAGGDDYISKPIKIAILISRIKATLRRYQKEEQQKQIKVRDIGIDMERFEVTKGGEVIYLPKKEFELLSLLASKPGRVFHRREIFNSVWGPDVIVTDRTIDVHIRKLREKIGSDYITTVKGVGYKFNS